MPSNSKQNTSNPDEIDLLSLFVKMGDFLKKGIIWLISIFGSVLIYILRKWYYLVVAVILTVISALILNNISDPYYTSDLIMRSNATHNQPIMTSLDKLGNYARANNYETLSNELHVSIEEAGNIKDLETYWYYDIGSDGIFDGIVTDRDVLADTNVTKIDSIFILRASVYSPDILEQLEGNLINYLDANPFLKALNGQRLSDLEAQLNQIQYEIEKLDSLQKREYYTNSDDLRQKEGQIVFTSEKTVKIYHNDMFKLLKLKQECVRDINIYNDVATITEGFTIPVEPENGTILYIRNLIWYFLGLALLLSVIITYRKKIWAL